MEDTMIEATTAAASTGTTSAATSAASAGVSTAILGKDDFLKLLIMQLRYQDPMNPMQGTEFASQLAQFSSVEQLQNINTNLTSSLDANSVMTQSINNALATTFIGKQVRAVTDTFRTTGNPVSIGYTLPSGASTVSVTITDANGNTVRSINGLDSSKGEHTVKWDGKDDKGNTAPAGQYSFKITANDSSGKAVSLAQYVYGTVSAVKFSSSGTVFVVDGSDVPLSSIMEIMGE
jgi:flagellar basal-body rod modification protein FlgD